jgi:hypothetical protein
MKTLIQTVVLLVVLGLATAEAAIDCNKDRLNQDESLVDYLKAYVVTDACVKDKLKKAKDDFGLTDTKKPTPKDFANIAKAWYGMAKRFEQLSSNAPQPVPGQVPSLNQTFAALRNRAQAAGAQLEKSLSEKNMPDVAVFGHVAWTIPVQLFFPDVNDSSGTHFTDLDIETTLETECKDLASELCHDALAHGREFMVMWKLADFMSLQTSLATMNAVAGQIRSNEDLWNKYLYDSKPMLPFDFILTDLISGGYTKNKEYPDGFREPPKTQWFLFHPSAGIDYTSAARDGEQMKPMVYLEILGANRWRESDRLDVPILKYFSGASMVVTYADREGVKDTGYGLLLTFENVYSLGVTRYGSDTGVFLSLDLANLFREKYKPRYEKYKETVGSILKGK